MFTSGNWMVKKGNEQEFIDTWKAFAKYSSENMPGWAGYAHLLRDISNPSHFTSAAEWNDMESINRWQQDPEFKSYMKKFADLCENRQIVVLETVIKIGQLQAVSS